MSIVALAALAAVAFGQLRKDRVTEKVTLVEIVQVSPWVDAPRTCDLRLRSR